VLSCIVKISKKHDANILLIYLKLKYICNVLLKKGIYFKYNKVYFFQGALVEHGHSNVWVRWWHTHNSMGSWLCKFWASLKY